MHWTHLRQGVAFHQRRFACARAAWIGIGFVSLFIPLLTIAPVAAETEPGNGVAPTAFDLTELQHRTFLYFWELTEPDTGLVPDRYPTRTFSSIAATGFGLAAYVVGVDEGWIAREEAAARVRTTLEFFAKLPQGDAPRETAGYRGFFYHFLRFEDGLRFRDVELSTIDTALLMAGVLTCRTFFDGDTPDERAIRQWADRLYDRVEWDWALRPSGRLSMGWRPESGFLPAEWQGYNEAMILYLLALGSPTHPVPPSSWLRWTESYRWETFYGQPHVNFGPLFGHQYSHMFIDFRGIQDAYMRDKEIDYFENSRRATLSQRAYAIDNPRAFVGYGPNVWGLTACDGPENATRPWKSGPVSLHTYWARGACAHEIHDDGTLAPTAVGGSLPFAPEVCMPALSTLWNRFEPLVGEYGFRDAFNLSLGFDAQQSEGWFNRDYLGIDQGPIVLQIANHRRQTLWQLTKREPHVVRGLRQAGFRGGWLDAIPTSVGD